MDQYAKLTGFEDSLLVLKRIKEQGIYTAILSNGSKEMLSTVVDSNGLKPYLDKVVTVEDVRLFKTAPQAYELLLKPEFVASDTQRVAARLEQPPPRRAHHQARANRHGESFH